MIPELGHIALILALCCAVFQVVIPLCSRRFATRNDIGICIAQFIFLLMSFLILEYAFITNDFSVKYVTHHSHTDLPLMYRISALWGGHEGSLLLWVLMLSAWSTLIAIIGRKWDPKIHTTLLGVLGFLSLGFLLFIEFTSNPFTRLLPLIPENGLDLNPLLQDPALVIHPPLLYMGYVGFSVAFAFAITALIHGEFDKNWARRMRPWVLIAWMFLTIGIVIGSFWAYYVLGWGGWWFWDPVENASFMPWLLGCALIHSLAVVEKRNAFKRWTILLAIFTFSICLLGTFLVRSGILTSVHAFANDPARGLYILVFLLVVIGFSFILYLLRANTLKSSAEFDYLSRESFLLVNNILLTLACAVVFLGTLYPLFLEILTGIKISVGPPYFSTVFVPLMIALLIVIAAAPQSQFKHTEGKQLKQKMAIPLILAMVAAGIAGLKMSLTVMLVVFLAAFIILALLDYMRQEFKYLTASNWGMISAHLGVALLLLGVGISKQLEIEKDLYMRIGDNASVGPYTFSFDAVNDVKGPNYTSVVGTITAYKNDQIVSVLQPEKRHYLVSKIDQSQTSIDGHLLRDLYVALGEPLGAEEWSVRIYYKPFVRFIWLGGLLIALGALLAVFDKRYRMKKEVTHV